MFTPLAECRKSISNHVKRLRVAHVIYVGVTEMLIIQAWI